MLKLIGNHKVGPDGNKFKQVVGFFFFFSFWKGWRKRGKNKVLHEKVMIL